MAACWKTRAASPRQSKKKKFDLGLSAPSTERPPKCPMPAKLSLQPVLFTPTRTAIDALATSPWAPLAAVSGQKQVLLYNTQTLELLGVLPFPEGRPACSSSAATVACLLCGGGVAGASGRVVVWNVRTGERIIEVGDELDEVLAADISSDQTLIATGAGPNESCGSTRPKPDSCCTRFASIPTGSPRLNSVPTACCWRPAIAMAGLYVWEGWTGREYLTLKGHTGGVPSVSWRSDSNILASCSEDSTIRLWEMENGGEVKNWGAHGGGALASNSLATAGCSPAGAIAHRKPGTRTEPNRLPSKRSAIWRCRRLTAMKPIGRSRAIGTAKSEFGTRPTVRDWANWS